MVTQCYKIRMIFQPKHPLMVKHLVFHTCDSNNYLFVHNELFDFEQAFPNRMATKQKRVQLVTYLSCPKRTKFFN